MAPARLAAICAHSPQSQARARIEHPQAAVVGHYKQLLARDDVEVVDIVLPSDLHFEVASAALEAGKHVLLEKPMALDLADCRTLVRMANERNLRLAVGHELRLSSLWGTVKQLIQQGRVGQPQYALIELWRNPYRQGSGGWRYNINRVGSWILEEPIHFFDLARWYFESLGPPVSVDARAASRQAEHPELHDHFTAIMDFAGGAYAVVTQTLGGFEHHQTVKISGSQGALWASWSGAIDRTRHPTFWLKRFDGQTVREIPLDKPSGEVFELEEEVRMMAHAVRDDKPIIATGVDGLWSVAMCLAAEQSIANHAPQPLDPNELQP